MRSHTRTRIAVVAAALTLGIAPLAACGDDDEQTQPPPVAPAFELTTEPMSEQDAAAALPEPRVAPADAPTLKAGMSPGFLYGLWDPARGVHLEAFGIADHETGRL